MFFPKLKPTAAVFNLSGGNLGLFCGFSIMVLCEVIQLLGYLAKDIPMAAYSAAGDENNHLWLVFLETTVLHGLQYISLSR